MSTDRSRLVSSIRRIVLTDPDLSSALDAWQNRGDQASSTGVGTSDAERDRLCCDGSTSDNPNPGADTRDTSEGGQEGLNEDDPALLESGPGSLTGVTDCATGEPICFDGSDWIPPEGWDSPTDPAIDPTYEEGSYWEIDYTDAGQDIIGRGPTIATAVADSGTCPDCTNLNSGSVSDACYIGTVVDCEDETAVGECGGVCFSGGIFRDAEKKSCDGHESEDYCNPTEEEILAQEWPEDGCTNLAIKSGTIVGSKYDPENDGTYSKPMSEIELCDEFGNSLFLSPASNVGWKTIDATKTDGYLYDLQGNKIAHIDGNEYSDPDV